jgi:hypothetical protein
MDLVKKNWLSVLFGVIALCAIAADFWPMGGKYDTLRRDAQARATANQQLQQLESKPRNKPLVDPDRADPEPLGIFPTAKVIEAGNVAIANLADGAKKLQAEIVKLNMRQPLVPGALPGRADDRSPQIEFARAYVEATDMSTPEHRKTAMATRVMQAGIPPSEQDITREKDRIKVEIQKDEENKDSNGSVTNQPMIDTDVANAHAAVPENMRQDVATKSMVYINPQDTFSVFNPPITVSGNPPDSTTIFWAQVGLWVQEDFCRAVFAINNLPKSDGSKPKNVVEAPIKHVVKIIVPQTTQPPPFIGLPPASNDPNAVVPISPDPKPNYTAPPMGSPFGRVSNGMYDVVHFDVEMNVEADRVPMILEELGRGRFLSVVQVTSITSLDSSTYHLVGYYYGNKPVVNLKLKCEDIFLRDWTVPLMPPTVQKRLGVTPPATPPA